jgi:hypothetical protein
VDLCVSVLQLSMGPISGPSATHFKALAAAIGTHATGLIVCTGGVRTIPGAMGPRSSGATTYALLPAPSVTPGGA